jgi:hypothetical protein
MKLRQERHVLAHVAPDGACLLVEVMVYKRDAPTALKLKTDISVHRTQLRSDAFADTVRHVRSPLFFRLYLGDNRSAAISASATIAANSDAKSFAVADSYRLCAANLGGFETTAANGVEQ